MRKAVCISGLAALAGYASGFVGAAAYDQVPWSRFSPGDWGTWFGAVAAVGAFIGTLQIARQETRLRRRVESDLAIVAAAAFSTAIHDTRNHLQRLLIAIPQPDVYDYASVATDLERLTNWTREDIVPLVALDRHVASKLAMAKNMVHRIASALRHHSAHDQLTSPDFRVSLLELISVANAVLAVPDRVCREYADPDAIMDVDFNPVVTSLSAGAVPSAPAST